MTARDVLDNALIGAGIAGVILIVGVGGYAPRLVTWLLFPGLGVAGVLGFGTHDLATIATVFIVNTLLYAAVAWCTRYFVRKIRGPLSGRHS